MELAVGQIWKEVDPRFERSIRIEKISAGTRRSIQIRTVEKRDGEWREAPRSRISYCDRNRFNEKRGGYAFQCAGGNGG